MAERVATADYQSQVHTINYFAIISHNPNPPSCVVPVLRDLLHKAANLTSLIQDPSFNQDQQWLLKEVYQRLNRFDQPSAGQPLFPVYFLFLYESEENWESERCLFDKIDWLIGNDKLKECSFAVILHDGHIPERLESRVDQLFGRRRVCVRRERERDRWQQTWRDRLAELLDGDGGIAGIQLAAERSVVHNASSNAVENIDQQHGDEQNDEQSDEQSDEQDNLVPEFYEMTLLAAHIGFCLICNMVKYDDHSERLGAKEDEKMMTQAFQTLNFSVASKPNLKAAELRDELEKYSKMDHSQMRCFACVVMAHGDGESVTAVDNQKVTLRDLLKPFECDSLKGKPKLFFVQACRGDRKLEAKSQSAWGIDARRISNSQFCVEQADFLVSFSTVRDCVAWRHDRSGSLYVRELSRVLTNRWRSDDLATMLATVARRVSEQRVQDDGKAYYQVPVVELMLTKLLLFDASGQQLEKEKLLKEKDEQLLAKDLELREKERKLRETEQKLERMTSEVGDYRQLFEQACEQAENLLEQKRRKELQQH